MTLRDACLSLSLANLTFFSVHGAFRSISSLNANQYYVKNPLTRADHLALIVNIVLLALFIFVSQQWARRGRHWRAILWRAFILIVASIGSVGLLRVAGVLNTDTANAAVAAARRAGWLGVVAAFVTAVAVIALLVQFWARFVALGKFVLISLVVLAVWTLSIVVRGAIAPPQGSPDYAPLPLHSSAGPATRVMLLVYDEADYRLLFEDRPSRVALPELERLRGESVFASSAFPPSNVTQTSIPALTTGSLFSTSTAVDGATLFLHFNASNRVARWASLPNIFSDAISTGVGLGIVGWAHPYGRLFRSNFCRWYELPSQANSMGDEFGMKLLNQWRMLFETPRLSPFGQSLVTQKAVKTYLAIRHDAALLAADPRFGLKFIHFSIPHSPHIYNLEQHNLSLSNDRYRGYLGNLVLIDDSLREIRRASEKVGLWDQTTVILTSDHWCRYSDRIDGKSDHRIPFMVKMPGQTSGATYEKPFNTVLTRQLISSVFRGEIANAEDLQRWLAASGLPVRPVLGPGEE